ncbi:hypothetical protein EXIGLDRAFT_294463 [Exidia glandulosa HHB12029]|uniref:Uncharacterized protein n=1 Tax=Exidia glandulosa HHB12029 TaxID=1314781 RepID=A0A165DDV4_EXIGL|nr:hypothetical protein EXIGLDRAFT_294463 [Exidia glandulosa HHB12029]
MIWVSPAIHRGSAGGCRRRDVRASASARSALCQDALPGWPRAAVADGSAGEINARPNKAARSSAAQRPPRICRRHTRRRPAEPCGHFGPACATVSYFNSSLSTTNTNNTLNNNPGHLAGCHNIEPLLQWGNGRFVSFRPAPLAGCLAPTHPKPMCPDLAAIVSCLSIPINPCADTSMLFSPAHTLAVRPCASVVAAFFRVQSLPFLFTLR